MTTAKADRPERLHIRSAIASIALSFALAFSLVAIPSGEANADIRKTDIIGNGTLEERAIPAFFAPNIAAKYAYLEDSNGNVYFSRDSDTEVPIASVTKIMTAIVAMESAPLDATIVVSEDAGTVGESTSNLIVGDKLTLQNALIGLMVSSGNDAAVAIAESLGDSILEEASEQGTELVRENGTVIKPRDADSAYDAFVAAMNDKAQELECTNTLFTNPHGLDYGKFEGSQHSTAKDVATMAEYAMRSEVFRDIVKMETATFPVTRGGMTSYITVESTDTMLGHYEGACGIKTGFTDRAGDCFVGACERGGVYLYAIILNAPTHDQRFADAEALYNWVYTNQRSIKLANSDVTCDMMTNDGIVNVPVVAYVPLADWIDKTVPATFADDNAEVQISAIFGNVSQDIQIEPISGSVKAGQVIGHADFYQNNAMIASQEIVACEDAPAPNFFEMLSIGWQRFMNNFSEGQDVSDPVILNRIPIVLEKA